MKPDERMFVTWEPGDYKAKAAAMLEAGQALRKVEPVLRTAGINSYLNIAPNNVSVREGFNRQDYDNFRPEQANPYLPKDIIAACMTAYNDIGIVRNVIDLMSDFAVQGIDFNHTNEKVQKFYKEWFRSIKGKLISERFLNLLFRTGNVIVQRQTAKINVKKRREMERASGADMVPEEIIFEKKEIPWKYIFKNPLATEIISEDLAVFVGEDKYVFAIKCPKNLIARIKNPKNTADRELVNAIPPDIRKLILQGTYLFPLPVDKVRAFFYKKDDWDAWAKPMFSCILSDLNMLHKMKLADLAALDGAISSIRVWKLGNIDKGIMPTSVAINRLAEMLTNNVGGGVIDLVWGPELELLETKTDVHHFLGQTKYEPVLKAIYTGLGVPPTLTGDSTAGGFTNNFISLKTLTERLQYGRDVLSEFWNYESRLVQKAMGFKDPAVLVFDRMILSDEATEKRLLIELAEKNFLSMETLQERCGEIPEIEQVRLKREEKKRRSGKLPPRADAYHIADKEHEYKKLFVQSGLLAPSQLGIKLDEKAPGEESPAEIRNKGVPDSAKTSDNPDGGRPPLSKDKVKRKRKRVTPRTRAEFLHTLAWAENTHSKITELTTGSYLKCLGKKNLRELTDEEVRNFENFKLFLLYQFNQGDEINEKTIAQNLKNKLEIPVPLSSLLKKTIAKHKEKYEKEPTMEVLRRYYSSAIALWKMS